MLVQSWCVCVCVCVCCCYLCHCGVHVYRSLCEARDQALSERNRAVASEKETRAKYESLLKE